MESEPNAEAKADATDRRGNPPRKGLRFHEFGKTPKGSGFRYVSLWKNWVRALSVARTGDEHRCYSGMRSTAAKPSLMMYSHVPAMVLRPSWILVFFTLA